MQLKRCQLNSIANTFLAVATTLSLVACQSASESINDKLAEVSAPTTLFTETVGVLPTENRGRRKWDGAIVGDLDGNGFQDLILTEHSYRVRVFWNEGGYFTGPQDLISGDMHGLSIADLDNNGLIDVLIAQGGGNGANPKMPKHFEITKDRKFIGGKDLGATGSGVETIDYDKDGDLDLITANERGRWHLYKNNAEKVHANNFIGVSIKQSPNGQATAFGAQATLTACSQKATRTVGNTSSSFAVTHNTDLLFGLGKCNKIDSIEVTWTNGEVLNLKNLVLNQYVNSGN